MTYKKFELPELRAALNSDQGFYNGSVYVRVHACHLAYAFLRDVPYRVAAPTARLPGATLADATRAEKYLRAYALNLALDIVTVTPGAPSGPSSARVDAAKALAPAVLAWLQVPESIARRTWRIAREEAARARRAPGMAAERARWAAFRAARAVA